MHFINLILVATFFLLDLSRCNIKEYRSCISLKSALFGFETGFAGRAIESSSSDLDLLIPVPNRPHIRPDLLGPVCAGATSPSTTSIERHHIAGVAHFAVADKVYDLQLFEEIRRIKYVHQYPWCVLSWPKKCIFHSLISGKKCKKLKGWQKLFLRNIKGANLLVDPNGRVKLADFGMAKHISGQSCPLSFKGSPYWMAPEVIKNTNSCCLVVDIWSLGCTLIQPIKDKYSGVTYADLFQLASATAIEEAGGPKIPMKYGRVDVTGPEQCPAERKLPG
uniref:Glycosyltransferases n=1 Tax=Ananas comosus var. bracteatus TaxID=296719 RepID=A0A6V7P1X2_ANACO|nr:unnamed protein product [Ananas comosus var. bracteatus]